ncbi:uncharacterized protein C9orf85 homolog isoform X2 [Mauremys reevesii]|uniref:uncharacterized protein C9orf85 homolog isoform X2 n=1 Tax=Mauremys reevesii TaxID=260615 RepID=UPI0019400133|nr:uncharacterized protein C9orf85 homolog isoform X2 [Mauremys reevesii]
MGELDCLWRRSQSGYEAGGGVGREVPGQGAGQGATCGGGGPRCGRMSSQRGNVARSRPQRHQNSRVFKNDKYDTSAQRKLNLPPSPYCLGSSRSIKSTGGTVSVLSVSVPVPGAMLAPSSQEQQLQGLRRIFPVVLRWSMLSHCVGMVHTLCSWHTAPVKRWSVLMAARIFREFNCQILTSVC